MWLNRGSFLTKPTDQQEVPRPEGPRLYIFFHILIGKELQKCYISPLSAPVIFLTHHHSELYIWWSWTNIVLKNISPAPHSDLLLHKISFAHLPLDSNGKIQARIAGVSTSTSELCNWMNDRLITSEHHVVESLLCYSEGLRKDIRYWPVPFTKIHEFQLVLNKHYSHSYTAKYGFASYANKDMVIKKVFEISYQFPMKRGSLWSIWTMPRGST